MVVNGLPHQPLSAGLASGLAQDALAQSTSRREQHPQQSPTVTPQLVIVSQEPYSPKCPAPCPTCPSLLAPLCCCYLLTPRGRPTPHKAVWNSAAHWILGAFRTTPTTSLLIKAGLPPVHLLLKHARLRYALRVACAQPPTNTAAAALPHSFPAAAQWHDPFTGPMLSHTQ